MLSNFDKQDYFELDEASDEKIESETSVERKPKNKKMERITKSGKVAQSKKLSDISKKAKTNKTEVASEDEKIWLPNPKLLGMLGIGLGLLGWYLWPREKKEEKEEYTRPVQKTMPEKKEPTRKFEDLD